MSPRALPLTILLLCLPAPARADPPPRVSLRLDYARAPGAEVCPTEGALHDEVARRMGYDPFEPSAAERLSVVVARQGRGLAARIERYAPSGAQTWAETFPVRGDDCGALISGVAAEIRALLAPGQTAPGPAPAHGRLFGVEPYTGPAPGGPSIAPPVAPPPDVRAAALAAPPERLRAELAASAHITLTGAPAVTGGATVRAAVRGPWWSVGAEGRFDAPASGIATASGIAGAQYRVRTFAGSIVPCAYYPNPYIQPFGCVVLSAGAVSGEGSGVSMPASDTGLIIATGPRVGLDIPLVASRLSLRATFDALFFPRGARAHLAGVEVWRTPVVSGLGGIGLAVFL